MQMVNTRRGAETSQQGAENNPPPPPQTLAEVVAQQTQLLQMLVQNQTQQQQPHGRQGQPQLASYSDFVGTHPPIFSKSISYMQSLASASFGSRKFLFSAISYQKKE